MVTEQPAGRVGSEAVCRHLHGRERGAVRGADQPVGHPDPADMVDPRGDKVEPDLVAECEQDLLIRCHQQRTLLGELGRVEQPIRERRSGAVA